MALEHQKKCCYFWEFYKIVNEVGIRENRRGEKYVVHLDLVKRNTW